MFEDRAVSSMEILILIFAIVACTNCERSLMKDIYINSEARVLSFDVFNTTIEYFSCDGSSGPERNCSLTKQKHDFVDKIYTKYCKIVSRDERLYEPSKKSRVFALDDEKTILVRGLTYTIDRSISLILHIVTWQNCEVAIEQVPLEDRHPDLDSLFDSLSIVSQSESYELIYEDSKACKGSCSAKFAKNGPKLRAPIEFNFETEGLAGGTLLSSPISSKRPWSNSCFEIFLAERLHASVFLHPRVKEILKITAASTAMRMSTASGMWSLCKLDEANRRSLLCTRGNTFSWSFLNFHHVLEDFVIYSLPGDWLMTVTSAKSKPTDTVLALKSVPSYQFTLTVFHNYEIHRKFEIAKFECSGGPASQLYVHVYENDSDEYCVTLISWTRPFKLVMKCYTREFLMKKNYE